MTSVVKKAQDLARELESGSSLVYVLFNTKKGDVTYSSASCHSPVGGYKSYSGIGTVCPDRLYHKSDKSPLGAQFLEWLYSEDSFYSEFLEFLGPDFHVLRAEDGRPLGCYITNVHERKVAILPLMNFLKAHRTLSEHSASLHTWDKWVNKHKIWSKSLAYMIMYHYNKNNAKLTHNHSPVELSGRKIDVEYFFRRRKGLNFQYEKEATSSYRGESMFYHKEGDFSFLDIPKKGYIEIPSYFYKKYNAEIPTIPSDEDMILFFNGLQEKFGN